VEPQKSVKN